MLEEHSQHLILTVAVPSDNSNEKNILNQIEKTTILERKEEMIN